MQFDRRELGVELVKDVDVMPSDPGETLPLSVIAGRPSLVLNGRRWLNGAPLRRPQLLQQQLLESNARLQLQGRGPGTYGARPTLAYLESARIMELQTLAEVRLLPCP